MQVIRKQTPHEKQINKGGDAMHDRNLDHTKPRRNRERSDEREPARGIQLTRKQNPNKEEKIIRRGKQTIERRARHELESQ